MSVTRQANNCFTGHDRWDRIEEDFRRLMGAKDRVGVISDRCEIAWAVRGSTYRVSRCTPSLEPSHGGTGFVQS